MMAANNLFANTLAGIDPEVFGAMLKQQAGTASPTVNAATVLPVASGGGAAPNRSVNVAVSRPDRLSPTVEADRVRRQQVDMDTRQNALSTVPQGLNQWAPLAGMLQGMAGKAQRTRDQQSLEELYGAYAQSQAEEAAAAQAAKQQAAEAARAQQLQDEARKHALAIELERKKQEAIRDNREPEAVGPGYDADQENKLRKEFGDSTKTFAGINDAFGRLQASAKNPSAAGDLSLIFNYMKILDPGSTVREGEFAQAAAAGDFGERLQAAGESLISGKKLTDTQRADFLNRGGMLYNEALKGYDQRAEQYTDLAGQYNARPEAIIRDRGLYRDWEANTPKPEPVQAPQSAINALQDDPSLAGEFQAKYGYLP